METGRTDYGGARAAAAWRSGAVLLGALLLSACAGSVPLPEEELAARLHEHNLLLIPTAPGRHPAVLLLHTCYGNLGHVDRWAHDLESRGYVALVVNSMRARRLNGFIDRARVCSGGVMPARDRARDVRLGLAQLRASDTVDPDRIAVIGFSHGGWTALEFLGSDAARAVKAVALVYPYCGEDGLAAVERWPRELRVLMLLAGNDTTVSTAQCERLAAGLRERGFDVALHVYPGARHGYDIDPELIYGYERRYDPSAAADTRRRILETLEAAIGVGGKTGSVAPLRRDRRQEKVQDPHRSHAHDRARDDVDHAGRRETGQRGWDAPRLGPKAMAGMNANEEARKTGTRPRVTAWKSRVPAPAVNSATLGSSPVSSGTSTSAPNATSSICTPSATVAGCRRESGVDRSWEGVSRILETVRRRGAILHERRRGGSLLRRDAASAAARLPQALAAPIARGRGSPPETRRPWTAWRLLDSLSSHGRLDRVTIHRSLDW